MTFQVLNSADMETFGRNTFKENLSPIFGIHEEKNFGLVAIENQQKT